MRICKKGYISFYPVIPVLLIVINSVHGHRAESKWTLWTEWTVALTTHRLRRSEFGVFPEVMNVGEGTDEHVRALAIAEVVFENGCDFLKDDGITGHGGEIKTVLAATIGIVKSLALRRTKETLCLLYCFKIDDVDFLHHYPAIC